MSALLSPVTGAPLQQSGDVDPGTQVVVLVGAALLVVLSARLAYLAVRTRRRVARPESALWEYFAFAGVVGVAYGALELVGLWAGAPLPFANGLLLAFVLLFALAMREAYFNARFANAERDRIGQFRYRRGLELGFVGAVLVTSLGPIVVRSRAFTVATAATAALVVIYGLYYQFERSQAPATRGTLIDTLLRQTVPVLVFAGGALLAPLLAMGTTDESVARAVAGVFVVVTASSLMTVTIKLRQHLTALR